MKGKVMRRLASVTCIVQLLGCASAPPVGAPSTDDPASRVIPITASYLDEADIVAPARAPDAAVAPEALVPQNVHRGAIVSLVVDPRGRYVIAVDDDAVVSLHDTVTGQVRAVERAAIRRSGPPAVSVDRSGMRAVIGVSGSGVEPARTLAWSLGDGAIREIARTTTNVDAYPSAVISPDGTRVVTLTAGAYDAFGTTQLEVHDFATGARLVGPIAIANPRSVGVSPSGTMVVVRTNTPPALRMFDATTLTELGAIPDVTTDAVWNPRGGQLVVASAQSLLVRSPRDARALGSMGVDSSVASIAFAADGECLAALGEDGVTRLRRASSFEVVHVARTGEVAGIAVLPRCAGLLASTSAGELTRHRPGLPETGELLTSPARSATSRFSAYGGPLVLVGDGTRVAIGVGEDVVVIDATSGEERARARGGAGEQSVWTARFSARGDALYVSGRGYFDVWTSEGARRTACGGPSKVTNFASGHVLVTSPRGICDAATGDAIPAYPLDTARTVPRVLVIEDRQIFVYDLATRTRGRTLLGPGTRDCPEPDGTCMNSAVISADGTRVAITARDARRIFVYDVSSAAKIATLDTPGLPSAMHFTSDGSKLTVVLRDTARVYPIRRGRPTAISGFEGATRVIASDTGTRFVVVEDPSSRSVVDLETGEHVLRILASDGLALAAWEGVHGAFVTTRDDVVVELVLAATGTRIAMGTRRLLGVSADLTRIATCTDGALHVTRLGVDDPPTPFGSCAGVDAVDLRADGGALALRQGTRVVLRHPDGREAVLRTVRSETQFTAFASNDRGEFSFPEGEAPWLCLRTRAPLADATCTNAPVDRRTQALLSSSFNP